MKIDQHPFPSNTVEVSSKDTSRVKLLTSDSAQNKEAVDPKVQVTAAEVKGKGLLLEEGDLKPRLPITSHMLINKFQHRKEKARGEKSGHGVMKDIGDVRSSSTARKKGSNYLRQKTVQSAMEFTTIATHLKEFALMTKDFQLGITVSSAINGS
jgi:hypothetical protein